MAKKFHVPFAAVVLLVTVLLSILKLTPISLEIFGGMNRPTVISVLLIIVDIFLICALFLKKRNVLALVPLGAYVILAYMGLPYQFPTIPAICDKLALVAHALLFIFVLISVLENIPFLQTYLRKIAVKLYFLPAIVFFTNFIIIVKTLVENGYPTRHIILGSIVEFMTCFVALSIAHFFSSSKTANGK